MEQVPRAIVSTSGKAAATEHRTHTGQTLWVWLPETPWSLMPCLQGWPGMGGKGKAKLERQVAALCHSRGSCPSLCSLCLLQPVHWNAPGGSPGPRSQLRGERQAGPHLPALQQQPCTSTTKALLRSNTDTAGTALGHLAQSHPDTTVCISCSFTVLKRQTHTSSGASYNE